MELVELPSRSYREEDAMAGGEDGRNATGVKKKGKCLFHSGCLGNGRTGVPNLCPEHHMQIRELTRVYFDLAQPHHCYIVC